MSCIFRLLPIIGSETCAGCCSAHCPVAGRCRPGTDAAHAHTHQGCPAPEQRPLPLTHMQLGTTSWVEHCSRARKLWQALRPQPGRTQQPAAC